MTSVAESKIGSDAFGGKSGLFGEDSKKDKQEENGALEDAAHDDDYIAMDDVDVWDDEEKDQPRRRSWDRARGGKERRSRYIEDSLL